MGNWCMKLINKTNHKTIVILILGLDNAGKTVVAKQLAKEDTTTVLPTMGFSVINLNYEKHSVHIYDLGGSEQIRNIWRKYYLDVHGLIYVVDSSDTNRLDECQLLLNEVLGHKQMNRKPVLLLANKQDCDGALDEIDLVEKLQIEDMVNKYQCPTLVQPSIAIRSPDSSNGLCNGFDWLMAYIIKRYEFINERVLSDMKSQQEQDIATKKSKKVKRQTLINGCFGDSWVPRSIAEYPQTPKRTFLLTALANSGSKSRDRPGSCPVRETRFNNVIESDRRIRSAVAYAAEPKSYQRSKKNKRHQSKYCLPSLHIFNNRNKIGVME